MMRRCWSAGCVAFVLALPLAGEVGAQPSATISASGWWTRSPLQQAPEDGLAVATAPDGTVTFAALMIDTGHEGVNEATLQMEEAGGVGAVAALRVCPTHTAWEPVAGGQLEEAPKPECDAKSVTVARAAEGIWQAPLATLLAGETGVVAIAVVPDDASPMLAFDIQFVNPGLSEVRPASAGAEPPPATRSDSGVDDPNPAPPSDRPVERVAIEPRQPLAPPLNPGPTQELSPPTVPSDDAAAQDRVAATAPDTRNAVAAAGPLLVDEPRPWGRAVMFVMIAAAMGVIAGGARRALDSR